MIHVLLVSTNIVVACLIFLYIKYEEDNTPTIRGVPVLLQTIFLLINVVYIITMDIRRQDEKSYYHGIVPADQWYEVYLIDQEKQEFYERSGHLR